MTASRLSRSRAGRRLLLAVAGFLLALGPAAAQDDPVRPVHDPHIIRQGDTYYIFVTGRGIPIWRSKDLLRWERAGHVFRDLPAWARQAVPEAKDFWAPDVSFVEGQYRLYYSVSTWGRNGSCIGLAVNRTLDASSPDYRWDDRGKVLESRPGRDDWNAIDAHAAVDAEGGHWLAWGSFWSGIKMARLEPRTGLLDAGRPKRYSLAARPRNTALEASFIVRKNGHYYLFVSFDQCARGVDSTYNIVVGRAREITGPYVDRSGKPMVEGGATLVLASEGDVRGPGHNSVLLDGPRDWLVHHYYDARARGARTLQIRPLLWADDGWPLAGEPYQKPFPKPSPATRERLAGTWDLSEHMKPIGRFALAAEGKVTRVADAPGPASPGAAPGPARAGTWQLEEATLVLRWQGKEGAAARSTAGYRCVIGPDGESFVGRDPEGRILRGVRTETPREGRR